ncbi:hypothetical protein ACO0LL_18835 [Undibacterium sp. TC4M20W]|uniref:hypothetical protein n=1 Tax=unclassified Undibacterium TaxID=2630295 RepID=UPI003BF38FD7
MPTQANNNQPQKSGNSQGGTHEQHVKAGQQSHKNDAQGSGQGSKSVSGNNTGNQQRNDSKSAPDSKNR